MNRRFVESQFEGKLDLEVEEGTKHKLYYVCDGEKKITRTQISRGRAYRELGDGILALIAEQLFLNLTEFKDAINCPMTKEHFQKIVIKRWSDKYQR